MGTVIERFDDKARRAFDSVGKTEVYKGELLRHPVYTRFLHWTVALFSFSRCSPDLVSICPGCSTGSRRFSAVGL